MRVKIIGVSVAVILSLAAILLVSTVPYFILDDMPIEVKEYTSQKIVRTLTPTETIILPEIQTIEIKEIKSSPIVEKTSEPSLSAQSFPFEAYAIGTTVDRINFLKYSDGDIGNAQHAFDSNHNLFTTKATTVTYFDRGLNTKTTWTIPELGSTAGAGSAVDSAGNYYYGQAQGILTKLVPSEDKFIQILIVFNIETIEISSSGEVYIMAQDIIRKINFDTGAVKAWSIGGNQFSSSDMALDSNGKIYYIGKNFQGEVLSTLDPITNVATSWSFNNPSSSSTQALAFDNNDDIFINHFAGVRGKIQKLDPTTNVLEEWVVPIPGSFSKTSIVVDSAGTVYFLNDLTRLVPSTGKFTQWSVSSSQAGIRHVTVDSNDDLWIAGTGFFGKVTAAP